jgi:6-phosphogluconolactonase
MSSTYKLECASDPADFARRAAETMATAIDLALDQRDRAQIALSGGSTPGRAYSLLAQQHLPWDRVDVVLGDERWVSADDEASNARLLRSTLLAPGTPGAHACFHPAPTVEVGSPEASADALESLVCRLCPGTPPVFDLMVLGLGDDGHTASLFPGTDAPQVKDRWTTIGRGKGLDRITLTAPVLSAARKVVFLICGESKRDALRRLLDPQESEKRTPARLVQPSTEIVVLTDEAACAGL